MALAKVSPARSKRSSPTSHQNLSSSTRDLKQRVISCLNKLSDRDTHAIASSELQSIADNLTHDFFLPFISCISDTDSSHKSPVRQQCVRLLGSLSFAHRDALAPLLPRMIASVVVRRLKDPDSSVRSACVDAVTSMASHITRPPFSVFLKPLSEVLLLEQDFNSQIGSALCLSAAIEAAPDPDVAQLQRLLPRLLKLMRSESFKAKPAMLSLVGSIVAVGAASSARLMDLLIPCLVGFLSSDDWAVRKSAAETLTRVAQTERNLLSEFKLFCLSTFEARRFDKVKVVREAMNRMVDVWKDIPDICGKVSPPSQSKSSSRENAGDDYITARSRASNTLMSGSPYLRKKSSPVRKSPPSKGTSGTPTSKMNPPNSNKKSLPTLFHKLDHKNSSDWKIEIAVPHTPPLVVASEDCFQNGDDRGVNGPEQGENVTNRCSKVEAKRVLFEKNCEEKTPKIGGTKSASRVVPFHEKGSSDSTVGQCHTGEKCYESHRDNDLSMIRKQLVQIENQQSSLLDLLQRFIGSSQNGIRSLETRVHGLEMALDEISHDFAVKTSMPNTDTAENTCCKLPGAEFLSSKFWRKTEGRFSSLRFLTSSATPFAMHNVGNKEGADSSKLENQSFGLQGGFVVNPLAEVHPQTRGSSEFLSNRMTKSGIIHETEGSQVHQRNHLCEASPMIITSSANMISSAVGDK